MRETAAKALGELGKEDAEVARRVAALFRDPEKDVRRSAIFAIGKMEHAAVTFAGAITGLLDDENGEVQREAAETLRKMAKAEALPAKVLATLLRDRNSAARADAAAALDRTGNAAGDLELQASMLAAAYAVPTDKLPELRAHLRLWSGDNAAMQCTVTWLGEPDMEPMPRDGLSAEESEKALRVFLDLWNHTAGSNALRHELSVRIAQVAKAIPGKPDTETQKTLNALAPKLKAEASAEAAARAVEDALSR